MIAAATPQRRSPLSTWSSSRVGRPGFRGRARGMLEERAKGKRAWPSSPLWQPSGRPRCPAGRSDGRARNRLRVARCGVLVTLFTVALAIAPRGAAAEDPPPRPLPDYEGRPPPAPSAGDVALWIPRVIFSPVYFVSEFLIRRPIGALIRGGRSREPAIGALRLLRRSGRSQGGAPRRSCSSTSAFKTERGALPLLGRRALLAARVTCACNRSRSGAPTGWRGRSPSASGLPEPGASPRRGGHPPPGSRLLRHGSEHPRVGPEPLRRRLFRRHR